MRARIAAFGVVVLLLTALITAQSGGIAGVVRDASGGVLPGVTVEVHKSCAHRKGPGTRPPTSTAGIRSSASREDTYTVTFTLQGFAVLKREGVVITSEFTDNVNAELKVGDLKETITVTAEVPVVDVQSARVQQVFSGAQLSDLTTARDAVCTQIGAWYAFGRGAQHGVVFRDCGERVSTCVRRSAVDVLDRRRHSVVRQRPAFPERRPTATGRCRCVSRRWSTTSASSIRGRRAILRFRLPRR